MRRCSYLSFNVVAMATAIVMHCTPVTAQKHVPPAWQAQENSYQHLIGTEFEGGLIIPGWEDQGGGLMGDPVWYHYYKRDDNAYLVLIDWALPRKPNSQHTPFRVTDVLLIPPIAKDLGLTFLCEPPRTNVFEKIFAVVGAKYDDGARLHSNWAGFPQVTGKRLEWRYHGLKLVALIVRIARTDTSDPSGSKEMSDLIVWRVDIRKLDQTCLIGETPSNEEARAIADDLSKTCPGPQSRD